MTAGLALLLAVAAQSPAAEPSEPLGWRVGPAAWSFNRFTFFEAVDKTTALGLRYIEAFEGQRVSGDGDAKMGADLPAETVDKIAAKLRSAGVKLTSIYIHALPGGETDCRRAFAFCRKLGIETIVSEPVPESLNLIAKLCDEYDIKVAIHNHPKGSSRYWHPDEVLKACAGRTPHLGACADLGHWQRSGINPVEGVRALGPRLLTLHAKDLNQQGPKGHDVPWGTGGGQIADVLREVHHLGLRPTLFAVEYEFNWENNGPEIARSAEFFRRTVAEMTASAMQERPLAVGWASADITPPRPVALIGQFEKRISTEVRDPLTATVLALEGRGASGQSEQAILVSCDLLFVQRVAQQRLQEKVARRLPDFDARKLFLNATHTHAGPGLADSTFKGRYDVSRDPGVMKASEYCEFFVGRVADAVVKAWQSRGPGGLSWAAGQAVVGTNRRVQYFDGTAKLYGDTKSAQFSNVEGAEDHTVAMLFLWTADAKLSGVVVNLACPAQEAEAIHEISADFWHDVREEVCRRHGKDLFILAQCAPAGDQSPHPVLRKKTEAAMEARRGLSRRQEIARRIANAVDDALPVAKADIRQRLVFRHTVAAAELPEHQPKAEPFYETDSVRPIEFHVLRLGEVALTTSPFELFVDYAQRIEGRSPATLTMQIQLCCSNSGYLPTQRAVQGAGYSADKFVVGVAGGQVLVEETLKRINELWP